MSKNGSGHGLLLVAALTAGCAGAHGVSPSPAATGDACANCHLPHGSTHAALLRDSQSGTCLSCHSEEIKTQSRILTNIGELLKTKQHLHGPVQDGECSTCHAPHGGQRRSLLAGAFPERFYSPFEEDRYALCFSCHDVEAFEEPEVEDETQFRNEKQNLHYVHVNKPKKGRSCGVCHVVHASNGRGHVAESTVFGTWRLPIGFTPTETGGACQPGCHRPYGYDRESPVTNLRKAQPIQPD